jgi:hypothetical protein
MSMAEWAPSIFMFVLAGLLIAYSLREYRQAQCEARLAEASVFWSTAPGRITASTVQTVITGDSTNGFVHYEPYVSFTYVVGEATHTGATIAFRDLRGWKKATAAIVARYPVGSEVVVHYDPNAPATCVLEAGTAGARKRYTQAVFGICVGVVIAAAGVIIPLFHLIPVK